MSANRTALARTYRPRRFSEVAMQDHVAMTLRSAVAHGRTAHAYLFCGPRGVGKTTAARVLAMALNCPSRSADGEPCGSCESCDRIWAGRTSLDVVEIDAASNRGVDDARELRERAMYAPTDEHRFKIYIIDEAHMLTREAWNALLKILEEPPSRVIFVFATTEPQKIQQAAPPILSRCQRFDFRRIPVAGIVERLRVVLSAEGMEADDDALVPIARRADGGMRDALSLLDQVLSFAGGRVTAVDVRLVLGLVSEELYLEVFEVLADRRYGDVFRFVQRVLDEGYDLTEFYRGLADAIRALLISRFDSTAAAEVRDDLRGAYAALAERFDKGDLLRMLAMVAELDTEGRFRKSANPRTMLEALLLRFAYLDRTVDIETLLSAVTSGAPSGGNPHPADAAPAAGGRVRDAGETASSSRTESTARFPEQDAARREARRSRERGEAGGGAQQTPRGATGASASQRSTTQPQAVAAVLTPSTETAPTARARAALDALLTHRRGLPQGLGFFLKLAEVVDASGDRIVIAGPGLERLSSDADACSELQRAISAELGTRIELQIRLAPQEGGATVTPATVRLTPEVARAEQLARLTRDQPALGEAVRAWDLELLD